jgi:hypothetical protein
MTDDSLSIPHRFTSLGGLERFLPEPKNSLPSSLSFQNVAHGVASIAKGFTGTFIGIDPEYHALLSQQMHFQEQMQRVSLLSNTEKSKHETAMSAVRNVRVG